MEEFVYEVINKDDWWWEVGRRALVLNLLSKYGGNDNQQKILEIGCGAGALLQELPPYGTAYGLDVADAALRYCRERGLDSVSLGDATALPYKEEQFDVVVSVDVLEHVEDDAGALGEIHRVCKTGGKVIVTVPAFKFLWSRRDVQCHHKRRYTLEEVVSKVRQGGFRIIKATYINMPLFFPLLMMVKSGQLSSKRAPSIKMDYALVPPPINKILSRVVEYEARLLRHTSLPIGSSIACVAAKRVDSKSTSA